MYVHLVCTVLKVQLSQSCVQQAHLAIYLGLFLLISAVIVLLDISAILLDRFNHQAFVGVGTIVRRDQLLPLKFLALLDSIVNWVQRCQLDALKALIAMKKDLEAPWSACIVLHQCFVVAQVTLLHLEYVQKDSTVHRERLQINLLNLAARLVLSVLLSQHYQCNALRATSPVEISPLNVMLVLKAIIVLVVF